MYTMKYKPPGSSRQLDVVSQIFIVGLSIKSLTEESSIIHFPFLLLMQQHILRNLFFNQNQAMPSLSSREHLFI